jgi:hypothetical protein
LSSHPKQVSFIADYDWNSLPDERKINGKTEFLVGRLCESGYDKVFSLVLRRVARQSDGNQDVYERIGLGMRSAVEADRHFFDAMAARRGVLMV